MDILPRVDKRVHNMKERHIAVAAGPKSARQAIVSLNSAALKGGLTGQIRYYARKRPDGWYDILAFDNRVLQSQT